MFRQLSITCFALILVMQTYSQTVNEPAVSRAVDRFYQSMLKRDAVALDSITATQLNFGHSTGLIQNKEAFIEDATHGPMQFQTIDRQQEQIALSGKTAVVRHQLIAKAINNGVPTDLKLSVLQVWQKQKGRWKLLARQAVKI